MEITGQIRENDSELKPFGLKVQVAAFDNEHEKEGRGIVINSTIYFPDGAFRDANPLGILGDPPEDLYLRAQNKVTYWETRFKEAQTEFEDKKEMLLSFAKSPYTSLDVEEAKRQLKGLRTRVRLRQRKLEAAKDELEEHTPQGLRKRSPEADAERVERSANYVKEIKKIEI